jgi:predicted transcriptional regulator of viral defense system
VLTCRDFVRVKHRKLIVYAYEIRKTVEGPAVPGTVGHLRTLQFHPARGPSVAGRALGCLPAEQFVPDLMKRLKRRYYVSLLSAAEFHGAAHQRPQALQVFLEGQRRPIVCGRVHVTFLVRKRLGEVPVQTVNTPRGGVIVSTPEATALDLVGYEQQAGGLNQVATVLSELAERIDAQKLAVAANAAPIVWAQRLGHLLQRMGAADKIGPLQERVGASALKATPLAPGRPFRQSPRDATWKVYVNANVEGDL